MAAYETYDYETDTDYDYMDPTVESVSLFIVVFVAPQVAIVVVKE